MKFSIIIPVYNAERYLEQCVDSVINQAFDDFEIILVEDGSPDNCSSICDQYSLKDTRIKVIHKINEGASKARNVGLHVAKGEYICFMDSDDYLAHNNVLSILAKSTFDSPDIVHYKFSELRDTTGQTIPCKFDYNIPTEGKTIYEIYCNLIDKDAYYNSAWSKIIKRELLVNNNIHFEEGIYGEDNEWYYNVITCATSLRLIDEPLYIYRRRMGSVTTSISLKNLKDQLYVLEKWTNKTLNNANSWCEVIRGSLAKQYCSAIILYSSLINANEEYIRLKNLTFLLDFSKTPRVRYFRAIKNILGIDILILILKLYFKIKAKK